MSGQATRPHRLKRLLRVQKQKRELEEWRLAALGRERSDIDRKEVEIVESLGAESILQGLFLDQKVRSLRRNDVDKVRNGKAQDAATVRLRTARQREKHVERALDDASLAEGNAAARSELEEVLDIFLPTRGPGTE